MSYDVEVKKGLGSTYDILVEAAGSGKISQQQAETFFSKLDKSGKLVTKFRTNSKGSYGRHEFKEGLSLWYNKDPWIFDDQKRLNQELLGILKDEDFEDGKC